MYLKMTFETVWLLTVILTLNLSQYKRPESKLLDRHATVTSTQSQVWSVLPHGEVGGHWRTLDSRETRKPC